MYINTINLFDQLRYGSNHLGDYDELPNKTSFLCSVVPMCLSFSGIAYYLGIGLANRRVEVRASYTSSAYVKAKRDGLRKKNLAWHNK